MKGTKWVINLLLLAGILVLINVVGSFFFGSMDLTEDRRFTLTESTEAMLDTLSDVVYVQVLLEGDFDAGFKRLQRATREMLDDMSSEAGGLIEYEFLDPGAGDPEESNRRRAELAKDGINPIRMKTVDVNAQTEEYIYPYAIFNYRGRQQSVNLIQSDGGGIDENVLNSSINQLEYEFATAIQRIASGNKPIIAFLNGHGELSPLQRKELTKELRGFYTVGTLKLDSLPAIPQRISTIIVAKPRTTFTEKDKFKLDQYLMNGGKLMWLVDRLDVHTDSLYRNPKFTPIEYSLDLDDLFFRSYGIRLNAGLVEDLKNSKIQLVVGQQDGRPQFELFPWYYHLVVSPQSEHPIVRTLDNINLTYANTIDTTIRTKTDVRKTVLLASSNRSRERFYPMQMSFDILRYPPEVDKFNKESLPVSVLLEGQFPSLYQNRVSQEMRDALSSIGQSYRAVSAPGAAVLVVADGDIAKNPVNPDTEATLPLGYNRYENYQYANKDFLLNALEYLQEEGGFLDARGKEIKLRLLDTGKARTEKRKWQLLNVGLPLALLGIFGFLFTYWRRRRWSA